MYPLLQEAMMPHVPREVLEKMYRDLWERYQELRKEYEDLERYLQEDCLELEIEELAELLATHPGQPGQVLIVASVVEH